MLSDKRLPFITSKKKKISIRQRKH